MSLILIGAMLLAAATGLAVVLTSDPEKQVFVLSANGLVLATLFLVLQAPDVALSEVGVGAALVPLLFLVAMAVVKNDEKRR